MTLVLEMQSNLHQIHQEPVPTQLAHMEDLLSDVLLVVPIELLVLLQAEEVDCGGVGLKVAHLDGLLTDLAAHLDLVLLEVVAQQDLISDGVILLILLPCLLRHFSPPNLSTSINNLVLDIFKAWAIWIFVQILSQF